MILISAISILAFVTGVITEIAADSEYRYVWNFEKRHQEECRNALESGEPIPMHGEWRGLTFWNDVYYDQEPWVELVPKKWYAWSPIGRRR